MGNLTEVDGKSALGSLTIWGGLIGLGTSLIDIAQQVIADPTILAVIPANVVPYVGAVTALVTIVGRITAKKKITGVLVPK